jgi:REP element-mobilizing transposase RayT
MSRPLRLQYPGAVYHVTARGNARQAIVRDDTDRQRFVATVASMVEQYQVVCHAWVLMNNHYHLLLETPQANLAKALRHLNGIYTQAFNRRHHRVGHLFQGRYKAIIVEKEKHLLELCRYVVLNPVRAKVVTQPHAWRWSSYQATAGVEEAPLWLTVDWVLGQFARTRGRAQREYARFVREEHAREMRPWEQVQGQIYLGSADFLQQVQEQVGTDARAEIPLSQQQPGRPTLAAIVRHVAQGYGQGEAEVRRRTRRPSEARQVAVYGARRIAGSDLQTIGGYFGLSYPAVSRRVHAIEVALQHDARLRKRVDKVLGAINKVKT